MKGTIDNQGMLRIERVGVLQHQYCPYSQLNGDIKQCGCWCPLFGEPESENRTIPIAGGPNKTEKTGRIILTICTHRMLIFDKLIDKR